MTIQYNLESFAGKPVQDYSPDVGLTDPTGTAYALRLDFDSVEAGGKMPELIEQLLGDARVAELQALVIGFWHYEMDVDSSEIVEALASARDRMPGLRALFLGDITGEEQEISWIAQSDVSPLLLAFPELEVLRVRGSSGLDIGAIRHAKLREFAFETGGLPASVMAHAATADCPELRHLELWLGSDEYGYNGSLDLLAPLLAGDHFPKLTYLGLKNSQEQDEIARLVAASPLLERLTVLDLGMGTLTDRGAEALLAAPALGNLECLDIRFHYVSPEMVGKLEAVVAKVLAGEAEEPDEDDDETHYFIAVSE
ncbi:MAG: STM4015 family protein [Planctomycetes bacterium]|nr:STM4015 family protein [Planctomycetota bacterium]MCB9871228.1 STM4015 family protein [Planctomycetota bacterium]MCB9889800.1 STM4015 family protein [Planctomycetota bacterium]